MKDKATVIERRVTPIEVRVDSDGRIEGYAAVFDEWSVDLGGFREKIRPGAFEKTVAESDVRALFNHDANYVLGRNKSGTLELSEDSRGLHYRVDPPETQWADDLRQSIRRGDINQSSFAFSTIRDDWSKDDEKNHQRELIEVRLHDVSPVTFPAYPQTSVAARSLASKFIRQMDADAEDVETMLSLIDQLERAAAPLEHPESEGTPDDTAPLEHPADAREGQESTPLEEHLDPGEDRETIEAFLHRLEGLKLDLAKLD